MTKAIGVAALVSVRLCMAGETVVTERPQTYVCSYEEQETRTM